MSADTSTFTEIDYEPEVLVKRVYRVICDDGACGLDETWALEKTAEHHAEEHRLWHRRTLETLEGDMRPCADCGSDKGPGLVASRYGGRPTLVCLNCQSDWRGGAS